MIPFVAKLPKMYLKMTLIAGLAGLAGFGAGTYLAPGNQLPLTAQSIKKLANAATVIQHTAVRPLSEQDLVDGAIAGIAHKVDSYSTYLSKPEAGTFTNETKGRFVGIGVEVERAALGLQVIAPLADSPADQAGIRPHDVIVSVDGQPTRDRPLPEVVKTLRGMPGTMVEVGVLRDGKELKPLTLKRTELGYSSVKTKPFANLLHLRVTAFQERTVGDALSALKAAHAAKPLQGVVLDLRGNPGGLLQAGVGLASLFLPDAASVTEIRKDSQVLHIYRSERGSMPDWLLTVPLAVLVDSGSASAAELVAGAIQAHRRGKVIGTRTYGKGSMQRMLQLPDGSALKITEAHYYTPAGRTPHEVGILPDLAFKSAIPRFLLASGRAHDLDADLKPLPVGKKGEDPLLSLAISDIKKAGTAYP